MVDGNVKGISGTWYGNYYYSSATTAYGFEGVFIETKGAITGNILDLSIFGEANVTGTFAAPNLQFTKVYYKGGRASVHYEGQISGDGKILTGKWEIPPLGRGTWIAWRVEEEGGYDKNSLDEIIKREQEAEKPLVEVAPAGRR